MSPVEQGCEIQYYLVVYSYTLEGGELEGVRRTGKIQKFRIARRLRTRFCFSGWKTEQ
jgi:hypothetical protein